eukprot:Colp12_sorted_trinity150504_noHs@28947
MESRQRKSFTVERGVPAESGLGSYVAEESTPLIPKGDVESEETYGIDKPYGSFNAYCVCVNYIIGTGVFGLPIAMTKAGLGFGIICLTVGGITATFCMNYLLEAMARAEGHTQAILTKSSTPVNKVTYRKFDYGRMSKMFMGLWGKGFCNSTVLFYVYGCLWAYAAVFSTSIASLYYSFADSTVSCDFDKGEVIPGCNHAYYIALACYAAVVVPMALLDVHEQAFVQLLLTFYRFTSFGTMLITTIIYMASNSERTHDRFISLMDIKPAGFAQIFTACALALNCHSNMPDALQPVKDKSKLKSITSAALMTATFVYMLLGFLCAIAFEDVKALITLNWENYTACGDGWEDCPKGAGAYIVQMWVRLFPVVDMLSVYPLLSLTLANNMAQSLPHHIKRTWPERRVRIILRLLASVPPIALAAGLKSLEIIFSIAGLFGFILEIVLPCLLYLSSKRYMEREYGEKGSMTPYKSVVSHPFLVWGNLVYGIVGFLVAAVLLGISQ